MDDDTAGLTPPADSRREGHQVSAAADVRRARSLFWRPARRVSSSTFACRETGDGLALIREFRAAAPGLRIIVLSGWTPDLDGKPETRMVDELLAKPVPSARLVSVVAAGATGPKPK